MTDSSRHSYTWRVFTAVGIVALSVGVLYLLAVLARVLLVVFAGVLMALFLGGGAEGLSRRTGLSRPPALALVIGGVVAGGAAALAGAGPSLAGQIGDLLAQLPEAGAEVQERLAQSAWLQLMLSDEAALERWIPPPGQVLGGVTSAFSATMGVMANAFVILFIGIYGAASPEPYVNGLVRLVAPHRRERLREVLRAITHALRWWLVGRLAMMATVGALTAAGLWVAGVPSPMALGLVAAVLSFVPYVGPLLSMVPAVMVALLVSGTKVLYVVLVFGTVQLLESYLITPLVQRRAVSMPPAALITAQIAMGVLAGATGIFLATPLAVTVIVLLQMLYVEDVLGDSVRILGQRHGGKGHASQSTE